MANRHWSDEKQTRETVEAAQHRKQVISEIVQKAEAKATSYTFKDHNCYFCEVTLKRGLHTCFCQEGTGDSFTFKKCLHGCLGDKLRHICIHCGPSIHQRHECHCRPQRGPRLCVGSCWHRYSRQAEAEERDRDWTVACDGHTPSGQRCTICGTTTCNHPQPQPKPCDCGLQPPHIPSDHRSEEYQLPSDEEMRVTLHYEVTEEIIVKANEIYHKVDDLFSKQDLREKDWSPWDVADKLYDESIRAKQKDFVGVFFNTPHNADIISVEIEPE